MIFCPYSRKHLNKIWNFFFKFKTIEKITVKSRINFLIVSQRGSLKSTSRQIKCFLCDRLILLSWKACFTHLLPTVPADITIFSNVYTLFQCLFVVISSSFSYLYFIFMYLHFISCIKFFFVLFYIFTSYFTVDFSGRLRVS